MGSDLYMEEANFRPRKPRVSWVSRTDILIETDVFYHGYREFYRGPLTPEIEKVVHAFGLTVPDFPEEKQAQTVYMVYYQSADSMHSTPGLPEAIFEDEDEAADFASKQPGYGLNADWFVRAIYYYPKMEKE